jgi:hypothetical protein
MSDCTQATAAISEARCLLEPFRSTDSLRRDYVCFQDGQVLLRTDRLPAPKPNQILARTVY